MVKAKRKTKKSSISKSRQELRKEKRLKKKENKRTFFSKKKKNLKDTFKKRDKETEIGNTDKIESDFELSDHELNLKLASVSKIIGTVSENKHKPKSNAGNNEIKDRFLEGQKREKRKQKELESQMKKRRKMQLVEANKEEDKVIRKLGKKLGINKHANDKSVHKIFNDGLDYALELFLPGNNDKMYLASKSQDNESDNEFQDDLDTALDEDLLCTISKRNNEQKNEIKTKNEISQKNKTVLKNSGSKHFKGEDCDLSDSDSELDMNSSDTGNSLSETEEENALEDDEDTEENFIKQNEEEADEENNETSSEDDQFSSQNSKDDGIEIKNEEIQSHNNEFLKNGKTIENSEGENWEDIYGRKRDGAGNIIEIKRDKYVPPQLRSLDLEPTKNPKENEKLNKLKRQLKGLLNRLTEANMVKISKEIESLYRSNSRFDMNNVFSELLMSAVVTNVLSKERLILEYTMLIAILHVNVGSETSAHLLQDLVLRFDELMENIKNLDIENKELDNITFVLSHMYTYKIFQHSLIFEIIKRLIANLCEKSVECILLIIRSIGFQLRKDDPLALRDAILSIQKKSDEIGTDIQNNSRYKFMIDVLMAIKNNNMHKIPQYDPSLAEHLKKILKNILKDGKYLSTLNITIDDLLNVDKKGKWWIVGSAWSGSIKDIGIASKNSEEKNENSEENFTGQLLELAKKQRMNTDDRRNIFCIIMSSEDYLDAFEKLLRLSIKDARLIVSIIIHCCLSEKNFNPYYVVLAEKFCSHDRKYFLAVQFAVWDKIKDIHSLNKQQIENLAKFVLYLIRKGSQSISILKVVEFTELDKTTLRFVRIIVLAILLGDKTEMFQVFKRIAPSVALNHFKNAIMLFIRHFLLKGSEKSHIPNDKMELLDQRINEVEEIIFNKNVF